MTAQISQQCNFCTEQLHFDIVSSASEETPDGSTIVRMECRDMDGSVMQHYRDKHPEKLEPTAFEDWSIG